MIERYTLPEMGRLFTDAARLERWLAVELAACEVMAADGLIPAKDLKTIKAKARFDLRRVAQIEESVGHDVIAFVTCVGEFVGPAARHIHRGLTSSDVVDTALGATLRDAVDVLLYWVDRLRERLSLLAQAHADTPCIGRTHGVHAEPTTFGFKIAQYVSELARQRRRLRQARKTIAVGKLSGPVGTYPSVTPDQEQRVLSLLGLERAPITTQVVSRDRHAELMFAVASLGSTVEKFALELRHLARTEVGEASEPFGSDQKGSSAMPHKRNPVKAERLCGLARLLRGYLTVSLENVALWHERDISHSSAERVVLPDALSCIHFMLVQWDTILEHWQLHPERMLANIELTRGAIFSSRVLTALTGAGMARDEAYALLQSHAFAAQLPGPDLCERLMADKAVRAALKERQIRECFNVQAGLGHVRAAIDRALASEG